MSSLKDLKDMIVRLLGLFLSLYYFLGFEEYFFDDIAVIGDFVETRYTHNVNKIKGVKKVCLAISKFWMFQVGG